MASDFNSRCLHGVLNYHSSCPDCQLIMTYGLPLPYGPQPVQQRHQPPKAQPQPVPRIPPPQLQLSDNLQQQYGVTAQTNARLYHQPQTAGQHVFTQGLQNDEQQRVQATLLQAVRQTLADFNLDIGNVQGLPTQTAGQNMPPANVVSNAAQIQVRKPVSNAPKKQHQGKASHDNSGHLESDLPLSSPSSVQQTVVTSNPSKPSAPKPIGKDPRYQKDFPALPAVPLKPPTTASVAATTQPSVLKITGGTEPEIDLPYHTSDEEEKADDVHVTRQKMIAAPPRISSSQQPPDSGSSSRQWGYIHRTTTYQIRPKIWNGLVCGEGDCAQPHYRGQCKKPTEEVHWEVMLPVTSYPADADKCVTCMKQNRSSKTVTHTSAEHGRGQWYDHPDNPPIVFHLKHHYHPAPGIAARKCRPDIPSIAILLERRRTRNHDLINQWRDARQAESKMTGFLGQSKDYDLVRNRTGRHLAQIADPSNPVSNWTQRAALDRNPTLASSSEKPADTADGFQTYRASKKTQSNVPNPNWIKGSEQLPSEAYRRAVSLVLSTADRAKYDALLKKFEEHTDAPDDDQGDFVYKKLQRPKISSEMMSLLKAKESEASFFITTGQRKLSDPAPKTQYRVKTGQATWRQEFSLAQNAGFVAKEYMGYPYAPQSWADSVGNDNTAPLEPITRSAIYHPQDYSYLDEHILRDLQEWSTWTLSTCSTEAYSAWISWFRVQFSTATMEVFGSPQGRPDDVKTKLTESKDGCIAAVKNVVKELREKADSIATRAAKKDNTFDYQTLIREAEEAFERYNEQVDNALKTLLLDDKVKVFLKDEITEEGDRLSHPKQEFWAGLSGAYLPAESTIKCTIARFSWPKEAALLQGIVDPEAEDPANVPVPDHS